MCPCQDSDQHGADRIQKQPKEGNQKYDFYQSIIIIRVRISTAISIKILITSIEISAINIKDYKQQVMKAKRTISCEKSKIKNQEYYKIFHRKISVALNRIFRKNIDNTLKCRGILECTRAH